MVGFFQSNKTNKKARWVVSDFAALIGNKVANNDQIGTY